MLMEIQKREIVSGYKNTLLMPNTVSLLKPRLMCYNISGDENEEIRDNH